MSLALIDKTMPRERDANRNVRMHIMMAPWSLTEMGWDAGGEAGWRGWRTRQAGDASLRPERTSLASSSSSSPSPIQPQGRHQPGTYSTCVDYLMELLNWMELATGLVLAMKFKGTPPARNSPASRVVDWCHGTTVNNTVQQQPTTGRIKPRLPEVS